MMDISRILKHVILLVVILNYPVVGQFGPTPAPNHRPQQDDTCAIETSYDVNGTFIIWDGQVLGDDEKRHKSQPRCLNDDKFLKTRICNGKIWNPINAPNCSYSVAVENFVPSGYTYNEDNNIYYYISETSQPWDNVCIDSGSKIVFEDLTSTQKTFITDQLSKAFIHTVWISGKRMYDYGPVVWTSIGDNYGHVVKSDLSLRDNYVNGCLSLTNGRLQVEKCNLRKRVLCIYSEMNHLLELGCGPEWFTPRYKDGSKNCYKLQIIQNTKNFMRQSIDYKEICGSDLFRLNSNEKTFIYQSLVKQVVIGNDNGCLFAVNDDTILFSKNDWLNVKDTISYVNWRNSEDSPQFTEDGALTADMNGEWYFEDRIECVACEKRLQRTLEPEITLQFNPIEKTLVAVIYNRNFLWRDEYYDTGINCFTNADYELIKSVNTNGMIFSYSEGGLEKITIYSLAIKDDEPGNYWCIGHSISNFRLIESNVIVANQDYDGDVFAMSINYVALESDLTSDDYLEDFAKQFRDFLEDQNSRLKKEIKGYVDVDIEKVRVMSVGPQHHRDNTTFLLHIAASIDSDDYGKLRLFYSNKLETSVSIQIMRLYYLQCALGTMAKTSKKNKFTFNSVKSTEYCIPEILITDDHLTWPMALIGGVVTSSQLCLKPNGIPRYRSCMGDFLNGGDWEEIKETTCSDVVPKLTSILFKLESEFQNVPSHEIPYAIKSLSEIVQTNDDFIPADIYFVGRLMNSIASETNYHTVQLQENDLSNIAKMYDSVMKVNVSVTRASAVINSTNLLLNAFDCLTSGINKNSTGIKVNETTGVVSYVTSTMIIYLIDPMVKNISGIALYGHELDGSSRDDEIEDLENYQIELIDANESMNDVRNKSNLEIASYLPYNLLIGLNNLQTNRTNNTADDVMIVFTIFSNDFLFQEGRNNISAQAGGKIISILIPGYGPNMPQPFPIFIRNRIESTDENVDFCGSWSLRNSSWISSGCSLVDSDETISICNCTHLTHFSYLLGANHWYLLDDEPLINESNAKALDLITLIGCSLSLVGLLVIGITAIVFPSWREKPGSKVLLQLSGAIALQLILFTFVNTEFLTSNLIADGKIASCVALGASLHYAVLVSFTWMLITAYLQFMRYVRVLGNTRPKRFFLKSFLVGWIAPLIPVLLVITFSHDSYVPPYNQNGICYPTGYALYFGVVLPIGFIISSNLIIFIMVLYNIIHGIDGKIRVSDRELTIAQLRLSVLLFFLLGLTWIFGFFASTRAGLIFSYLFCVTTTLQGFVLFIYFIVLDPITRKLWKKFFLKRFCCRSEFEETNSKNTTRTG